METLVLWCVLVAAGEPVDEPPPLTAGDVCAVDDSRAGCWPQAPAVPTSPSTLPFGGDPHAVLAHVWFAGPRSRPSVFADDSLMRRSPGFTRRVDRPPR